MSDESTTPPQSPVVANAQQALAIKDLSTDLAGVKKQIKVLWGVVAVLGVLVIVLAGFSFVGRFLGVRAMGGFPGRGGTFNGQQFNNGGGNTQQVPQTTPAP